MTITVAKDRQGPVVGPVVFKNIGVGDPILCAAWRVDFRALQAEATPAELAAIVPWWSAELTPDVLHGTTEAVLAAYIVRRTPRGKAGTADTRLLVRTAWEPSSPAADWLWVWKDSVGGACCLWNDDMPEDGDEQGFQRLLRWLSDEARWALAERGDTVTFGGDVKGPTVGEPVGQASPEDDDFGDGFYVRLERDEDDMALVMLGRHLHWLGAELDYRWVEHCASLPLARVDD